MSQSKDIVLDKHFLFVFIFFFLLKKYISLLLDFWFLMLINVSFYSALHMFWFKRHWVSYVRKVHLAYQRSRLVLFYSFLIIFDIIFLGLVPLQWLWFLNFYFFWKLVNCILDQRVLTIVFLTKVSEYLHILL